MAEPTTLTHTATDGYVWKYRRYEPAGAPRGHVVCVHGIQSHGGWYDHSCRRLSEAGFVVSFLDRRGSGMNEQGRGDAPGFRRLIDDVAEFLVALRGGPSPTLPVFLLGISWGGKVVTALLKRHAATWGLYLGTGVPGGAPPPEQRAPGPRLVDGIALLCPGFFPNVSLPLRERLAVAWSYLFRPRRLFPVPLSDPALFTASPDWQQFLRDDALSVRQATARFLAHSVRLDAYLRSVPRHATVPVLLLLAGQDRIIDNARTRRFVESFASADKTIIEYPEAHHTLEFEARPHRYLDDLIGWLGRHAANATPQTATDGLR